MKKGGGTGPMKPWQPAVTIVIAKEKVPNPIRQLTEKISYSSFLATSPTS
jgi:hypothetical protein